MFTLWFFLFWEAFERDFESQECITHTLPYYADKLNLHIIVGTDAFGEEVEGDKTPGFCILATSRPWPDTMKICKLLKLLSPELNKLITHPGL